MCIRTDRICKPKRSTGSRRLGPVADAMRCILPIQFPILDAVKVLCKMISTTGLEHAELSIGGPCPFRISLPLVMSPYAFFLGSGSCPGKGSRLASRPVGKCSETAEFGWLDGLALEKSGSELGRKIGWREAKWGERLRGFVVILSHFLSISFASGMTSMDG